MLRAIVFLLLGACAFGCHAQNIIHRCMDAQGHTVFTDRPCDALAAQPATAASTDGPMVSVRGICPTDIADLRRRLIDAFRRGDANALASLMQWQGYDQGSALAVMRELGDLVRHPLLDIGDASDSTGPLPASPASIAPASVVPALTLRLGAGPVTPPRQLRLGIVDRDGCLWLQP